MVHFIHSFSMQLPATPGTIAHEWIAHGAYAYVGSVNEPYLAAFLPPGALAMEWVNGIPFLIAARHWNAPAPFGGPWRVNLYGDPLALCPPPGLLERARLAPPDVDVALAVDHQVRSLLEQARDVPTNRDLGDAVHGLVLIGDDDLAIQTWRYAVQQDKAALASFHALGPLFRRQLVDDFVEAYGRSARRDDLTRTMLWHLVSWRLGRGADEATLLLLQSSLRGPDVENDLERLAPHLVAAFGEAHARNVIQRELESAERPATMEALRKLLAAPRGGRDRRSK
jgi:hypothetical protein